MFHCIFEGMHEFLNNIPRTKEILKLICLDKLHFQVNTTFKTRPHFNKEMMLQDEIGPHDSINFFVFNLVSFPTGPI